MCSPLCRGTRGNWELGALAVPSSVGPGSALTRTRSERCERTIDNCLDLALMIDLANADKHLRMPRLSQQRSKRSPKLVDVKRVLQVVLKNPQPATAFGLRLTPQGAIPAGPGAAFRVCYGNGIGMRQKLWENFSSFI